MPRSTKGEFTIQNFRFGLDTRRSELTSQPGTLARLINGHINQGAEVEKRKAFVKTQLPNNSFGLLSTPNGLMTFGSVTASNLIKYGPITIATWLVAVGVGASEVIILGNNPGFKVGDFVSISGTGGVLDGTTQTLTNVGTNTLSFTSGLTPSNGNGGLVIEYFSTLPTGFIYQQLTSPNTAYSAFTITGISSTPPNIGGPFTISAWHIGEFSSTITLTSTTGVAAGQVALLTGTGSSALDGKYTAILSVNHGTGVCAISTVGTLASGSTGTAYTYYYAYPLSIAIAGNQTATFTNGFNFNITGVTANSLTFLNGSQICADSVYVSSNNSTYIGIYPSQSYIGSTSSGVGEIIYGSSIPMAMTTVVAACLFNGLPFVSATFGSDGTFVFYNGSPVNDFINGEVFSNATSNDNLAAQLAQYINATKGYTASISGAAVTCASVNPTDTTKATPGGNFTIVAANTTASGTTTILPLTQATQSIIGESATASFTITAVDVNGSGNVTGVWVNSASDVNLLSGNIGSGSTTVAALATLVAANINTTAAIVGVSAQSNGGTVTITLPPGSAYNDSQLIVTVDNKICIENCYFIINVGTGTSGGSGAIAISAITPTDLGSNILNGTVTSSSYASTALFVAALVSSVAAKASTYTSCQGPSVGGSTYFYVSLKTVQSAVSGATPVTATATYSLSGSPGATIGQAVTNAQFKATLSTTSVASNTSNNLTVGAIATPSVTAKPIGGKGPYLYQWSYYSGSKEVGVTSPTSATTNFKADIASDLGTGTSTYQYGDRPIIGTLVAKFICTITDTSTTPAIQAITGPVTVTASYISGFSQPPLSKV